jgi:hypothetical protein|tara:strand:- start:10252 stop:10644 length:393 start_codon:yes stop_codon:yes gene_type:complete
MFLPAIASSLLITVLCATVIIKSVALGGWVVFSNLYIWSVLLFALMGLEAKRYQLKSLKTLSRFFQSLSHDLHGTRLPLAVCAAIFSMTGDDETSVIAAGLCATGCSLVCILRDLVVLAPVLPRYRRTQP